MRYLLEVAYRGTHYAGFQVQEKVSTVQGELERVLALFYKQSIVLTGSSRTDAGVHACQNFFHTDTDDALFEPRHVYNLNAMLPPDIVLKSVRRVADDFHCRFHATHRLYEYRIYSEKNPFLTGAAWYYPYPLNLEDLNKAAALLLHHQDYFGFSKRNSQVHTHICTITESHWSKDGAQCVYRVRANRFLRGMVRALVATMLQAGRGKISVEDFAGILKSGDAARADFSAPAHGLYLMEVGLPSEV